MDDAKQLWSRWQSLLAGYGPVFTRPGWVRFVQWVTGKVIDWEEHTITQILVSMDLESRWRAMEQIGRPRKWAPRMAAPQHHEKWKVAWHRGRAWAYGRTRKFRYKRILCQWSVSGHEERVHAFVLEVKGYDRLWFVVTTALDLSGEPVAETFAARFRQEDGFRDHKQRMGMEERRAWTKEPVLRTFQVQMVAMTLLRLMQFRLDAAWGEGSYWLRPEWNRRKQHPSILDLRRLFWRHRTRFSKLLRRLEEIEKVPQATTSGRNRRLK